MADREMQEVNAPELYSFETEGAQLEGVLLSIQRVNVKDKAVTQYTFRNDQGEKFTCLATWDLQRKISREYMGRYMVITYLGENKEIKKGDNCLREFRVQVEKGKPANAVVNEHGLTITDEDIPF